MTEELKQFNKYTNAEYAIGIGCDGISCKCKDLNISKKEEDSE